LTSRTSAGRSKIWPPGTPVNVIEVDPEVARWSLVALERMLQVKCALILYLLWIPKLGFAGALWPAIFHSISSFCNAGFAVFSDSLMSYQRSPLVLLVHMVLIVAGGLGFLTMEELALRYQAGKKQKVFRLSCTAGLS
jgi:trk system potassium uptake protein TrkH